jgi:hypothetical protein
MAAIEAGHVKRLRAKMLRPAFNREASLARCKVGVLIERLEAPDPVYRRTLVEMATPLAPDHSALPRPEFGLRGIERDPLRRSSAHRRNQGNQ